MKTFLLTIGIIVLLIIGAWVGFLQTTKSHSPEADVIYKANDMAIHVYYNRPFKKGREIFGGLVKHGKVWRTGANEASVFETKKTFCLAAKLSRQANTHYGPFQMSKAGFLFSIPNMVSGELISMVRPIVILKTMFCLLRLLF